MKLYEFASIVYKLDGKELEVSPHTLAPFLIPDDAISVGVDTRDSIYDSAIIIAYNMISNRNRTYVVCSDTFKTSKLILEVVKQIIELLPELLFGKIEKYNFHTLELDNGCKLFARSATSNSFRGMAIQGILFHNRSKMKEYSSVWKCIYPVMASSIIKPLIVYSGV